MAGAIVLLGSSYVVYGAIWLTAMMVVGALLHLLISHSNPISALVFGLLTAILIWSHRQQLRSSSVRR
jgi:hypothetical protein